MKNSVLTKKVLTLLASVIKRNDTVVFTHIGTKRLTEIYDINLFLIDNNFTLEERTWYCHDIEYQSEVRFTLAPEWISTMKQNCKTANCEETIERLMKLWQTTLNGQNS